MQYLQKSKGGFFRKTQSEQNQALSFTHPLNKYNQALQPKSVLFAALGHVFLSAHGTLVCSYTSLWDQLVNQIRKKLIGFNSGETSDAAQCTVTQQLEPVTRYNNKK